MLLTGCAAKKPAYQSYVPSVTGVRQSVTDAGNDVRAAQGAAGEASGLSGKIDENLKRALELMP